MNKSLNKALDITKLLEDKREGQGDKEAQRNAKLEILEHQLEKLEKLNQLLISREEERKRKLAEITRQKEYETKKKGGLVFGKEP